MAGRSTFTQAEIAELRDLIRAKQTADRGRQKSLRARMRRLGFYITDFADYAGFTVSDLDDLIRHGTIAVAPGDEPATRATTARLAPRSGGEVDAGRSANDALTGAGATGAAARLASDAEVAGALRSLDEAPRRWPASEWPPPGLGGLHLAGLYSWWVDAAGASDLTQGLELPVEPGRIYAGQTGATKWPSGTVGRATLASRIGSQHIRGRVRGSTFRRTLAAALLGELELAAVGPHILAPESERALTDWIRDHLEVAVHPFADRGRLGDLERSVLARLDPPLNLDGMKPTALRLRLRELRAALARGTEG
jgi:hypothetical protein